MADMGENELEISGDLAANGFPALTFLLTFAQPISRSQEQFVFQNGKALDFE